MSERSQNLFKKLQSKKAINALIGQSEDSDFDCKEWGPLDRMKGSIAKAACGFANATGGVIVIGMKAVGRGSNEPDVVKEERPVADVGLVSSTVLDIIQKLVEPGIEGVLIHSVRWPAKTKSGFVLVYVPESSGAPRRSKVDWKFYVRITSGTLPMEYFQIEDRFGRRPHARLIADIKHDGIRAAPFSSGTFQRYLAITLKNNGRGLARFPAVRVRRGAGIRAAANNAFDPRPLWPALDADNEWISFRGGANDVLYPGESLKIATLIQQGHAADKSHRTQFTAQSDWNFPAVTLITEAICDGAPAYSQSFSIEETAVL